MTRWQRRRLLCRLAAGAGTGITGSLGAAAVPARPAFPGRAVRLIVPFPPGGSADVVARLLAELPAQVGRHGSLAYGSFGQGSSGHVLMEMFARRAKLKLDHVPYKGENPLVADLVGGQVPLGTIGPSAALQHAGSGKIRALAVISAARTPLLPAVPTLDEAGFPGIGRAGWLGLFAPARTPAALVERISADAGRALADPAVRKRLNEFGVVTKGSTPAAFAGVVKADLAYWAQAIRAANVTLQ